jgi:transcriptional regulator with XRE-family HTH domain
MATQGMMDNMIFLPLDEDCIFMIGVTGSGTRRFCTKKLAEATFIVDSVVDRFCWVETAMILDGAQRCIGISVCRKHWHSVEFVDFGDSNMFESKRSESSMTHRLSANISFLRKARRWTQSDLAERVGVDTETISRFERGVTLPSLLTLEKISQSLQVGIGDLLAESRPKSDDQVAMLSAWLANLDETDKNFVLDLVKSTCNYLRD